jgi:hypothetical protein
VAIPYGHKRKINKANLTHNSAKIYASVFFESTNDFVGRMISPINNALEVCSSAVVVVLHTAMLF